MTDVFLDTSYFVALSNPRDQHHAVARQVAADLQRPAVDAPPVCVSLV